METLNEFFLYAVYVYAFLYEGAFSAISISFVAFSSSVVRIVSFVYHTGGVFKDVVAYAYKGLSHWGVMIKRTKGRRPGKIDWRTPKPKLSFWEHLKRGLRQTDIIAEVIDGRLPQLSRNDTIEELARVYNKPFLFVINKCDLITREAAEKIKQELGEHLCVFVSGKRGLGMRMLKEKIIVMGKPTGRDRIRVSFVGYPNVGKSSISNALAKRAKSKVSAHAGTTKGIQWVKAGSIRILDSPGVIPIDFDDEPRLALLAAKDPERLKQPESAAMVLLDFLKKNYPYVLARYGLSADMESDELLYELARKRNFLRKGGELDIRRATLTLLNEWNLGKIVLIP